MRKTTINGIEYTLHEYLAAEDLVGINIFRLIDYAQRVNKVEEGAIMTEIVNYMPELSLLVQAAVISPKLERPKMALVIRFVTNLQFRNTFTESFSGIQEAVADLQQDSTIKKE